MGWVGNNSGINSAFFSRDLVEQNVKNLICLLLSSQYSGCYFVNIGSESNKNRKKRQLDVLIGSPINKIWDYFIRNRLEKLVPIKKIRARELKNI